MNLPFDDRPPALSLIDVPSPRIVEHSTRGHGLLCWHAWRAAGLACTRWVGYLAEPAEMFGVILCGVPTWSVEAYA